MANPPEAPKNPIGNETVADAAQRLGIAEPERHGDPGNAVAVVTWNVARRRPSLLGALARDCRPDILTLQEVALDQIDAYRERLSVLGLKYVLYSGRNDLLAKRYGNIIASHLPLKPVELGCLKEDLPWPQAVAEAEILVNNRPTVVISVQVPNGSNNGWEKIDTFKALANRVRVARGKPCILTGDFNEPQFDLQDGRIVTWGQERNREGRFVCWDEWAFHGRSGTGQEWDAAVRWFFENSAEHGLRHAYWDARGQETTAVSHVSRGYPRWFDHIFVSADFRVLSCSYLQELRGPGVSDHSALMANLRVADAARLVS